MGVFKSWTLFGFGCCVVSTCFIADNNQLKKLPSSLEVTCDVNEGDTETHTRSFVIVCGVLWQPACTHISVSQLKMEHAVQDYQPMPSYQATTVRLLFRPV
jgi:hypothetical protein